MGVAGPVIYRPYDAGGPGEILPARFQRLRRG